MADDFDLEKLIKEKLEENLSKTNEIIDKVSAKIGREARKELIITSPKRTGDYAKSWSVKTVKQGLRTERVIHNRKRYRLTHLLEKGHYNRDGSRTRAIPHIKKVEEKAIKNFKEELERSLKNEN